MKNLILLLLFLFAINANASLVPKRLNLSVLTDSTGLALAPNPIRAMFVFGDTDSPSLNASLMVTYTLTSADSACLSTLYGEYLTAAEAQMKKPAPKRSLGQ